MKLYELREFIKLIDHTSLDELEWKKDGVSISITKEDPVILVTQFTESATVLHTEQVEPSKEELTIITKTKNQNGVKVEDSESKVEPNSTHLQMIRSPYIGYFYVSSSSDTTPYVQVGDKVSEDTVVCTCMIEDLQVSQEIQAGVNGEIVEVLVQHGQVIEYGQPLYLVSAKGDK